MVCPSLPDDCIVLPAFDPWNAKSHRILLPVLGWTAVPRINRFLGSLNEFVVSPDVLMIVAYYCLFC
jgi:hypothetical protein